MKLLDTPHKPTYGACITDQRLVAELKRRSAEQKVTYKKCLEDLLWQIFFPNEPRNVKPSKMQKACPICGSERIIEPNNGFPLQCECFNCKNAFDQPIWVIA